MGEAAALTLGATIVNALQIHSYNFLLDSHQRALPPSGATRKPSPVENQTIYASLLQHHSHPSGPTLQD
jgi:hypothetical protein